MRRAVLVAVPDGLGPGDEFIAETPSEYQGWNSVYDSDFSTTRIVTRFADTFAENLALAVGIPSGPSRK